MNTTHADVGRALAIFEELVELPKDAQRVALDAHCADHPRLQGLVLRMLEADDASRGPVHTGGADVLIASDIAGEMPATLGGYRVLRQLGAGGMGVVYEAEEDRPRRTVAIKTIHPWLVSPETRAWFEAEAHALGSLVHPGVPQIYAVGEDHDVLFVAMERVEGVDLRTALDGRSATERVRLVRALCDTVAHIHGRGLVHRDLKPANVRVTPEGVPKLLDFGLARTAQQGAQPMAGTLPYMAPELLEGPAPPDVRTDVYAMGVILFEALTGALPAGLRSDSFAEARTRAPSLDWAAACRDLDPDLAAIIIATTASDPADRFSTMDELGRELDRFLTHEPVLVRQGGWAYAVGKLFRRRPLLVGSSAVALAALVLTSVVAVLAAERSARDAREQAALRAEADVEAARALAFSRFVERVVLRANPRKATGERTLLDVTHSTAEALDAGDLAEHPVEQARMRAIVAETLFNTGDLPAAQAQLDAIRTAWTDGQLPDGPEVVDALHGLSAVARRDGRLAEAETALQDALRVAEPIAPALVPDLLHSRALIELERGQRAAAERRLERAVAMKRQLQETAPAGAVVNSMGQLGLLRYYDGHFTAAAQVLDEARALSERRLGADHVQTAVFLNYQGLVRLAEHDASAAEALARRALTIELAALPAGHRRIVGTRRLLAESLLELNRPDDAAAVLQDSIGEEWAPGRADWLTEALLARTWSAQGQVRRALDLINTVQAHFEADGDLSRWYHISGGSEIRIVRSRILARLGRTDDARADLQWVVAQAEPVFGAEGKVVVDARDALASLPPIDAR